MSGDDKDVPDPFESMGFSADPPPPPPPEPREPGDESEPENERGHTGIERAERFVREYRDRLALHPMNGWFAWNGSFWQREGADMIVQRYAMDIARVFVFEVESDPDMTPSQRRMNVARLMGAGSVEETVKLARPGLMVDKAWVDGGDGLLLNVKNGTIDLRTLELRAPLPADRLQHCAPVVFDPDATCPLFESFLELTQPDPEMRAFLQRLCGYTITGLVRDHIFPVMVGDGGNGKSTLFTALSKIMGSDLAIPLGGKMLTIRRSEQHETEVARLYQKRLAVSSEVAQGAVLDEGRVKDLTGGEDITARFLNRDHFKWSPTHKLVMITNHVPKVSGTDTGIWRRFLLVRWDVNIKTRLRELQGETADEDTSFLDKLRPEHSGILNWALAGCLAWQQQGLNPPESVKVTTSEFREESDPVGIFIKDGCVQKPLARIRAKKLFEAFEAFCKDNGVSAVSQTAFGREMKKRGVEKAKSNGNSYYLNIEIAEPNREDGDGPNGGEQS